MLESDRVVATTCAYCGVGCQMDLHIHEDTIFRVEGRFDNAVNYGNLCVKGRFWVRFCSCPRSAVAALDASLPERSLPAMRME